MGNPSKRGCKKTTATTTTWLHKNGMEWNENENLHENANKLKPQSCKNKPYQRNAANARERARMRVLSKAFGRLKTTLPWVPPDTKLSKLDTLRLATSYIGHLQRILDDDSSSAVNKEDSLEDDHKPPQVLGLRSWPYGQSRLLSCQRQQTNGRLLPSNKSIKSH